MAPKSSNPRGRGRGRATAAEKGKRKAPPSDSSGSSKSPSPRNPRRPRGPGINIHEGNEAQTESPMFQNERDKIRYDNEFDDRRLTRDKSIDFEFFRTENFEFPSWLRNFGLVNFLSQKEELYGRFVKMFYFYLEYDKSSTKCKSFVNGVHLEFNLRDFCEVMQLPFDLEDEAEDIPISERIEFLTGKRNLPETAFFARELKSIDLRILFNVVCNCLYPRAGGFDKVTVDDIELLYGIVTGNKLSLAHMMLQYMVQQRNRSNGYLPFGRSLTRLFKLFKVDLTKEKPKKFTSYNLISDSTLKRMRISKVDGVWKEKGKGHEVPEEEQAAQAGDGAEAEAEGPAAENFDHFPIDDLIGNPPSDPTSSPNQPTTSTQHASTSAPAQTIDLTPLMSFLESQFSQLNSRISHTESQFTELNERMSKLEENVDFATFHLENKLNKVISDFSEFQKQATTTQTKMEMLEETFARNCPKMAEIMGEIQATQNLQQEFLNKTLNNANVTLQDIRDNSDRICLDLNLPTLDEILKDLNSQVRREYRESRKKDRAPPPSPKPKSKPKTQPFTHPDIKDLTDPEPKPQTQPESTKPESSKPKPKPRAPRKPSKRSKPESSTKPTKAKGSDNDNSGSSSGSHDPDADPYADGYGNSDFEW